LLAQGCPVKGLCRRSLHQTADSERLFTGLTGVVCGAPIIWVPFGRFMFACFVSSFAIEPTRSLAIWVDCGMFFQPLRFIFDALVDRAGDGRCDGEYSRKP
jgi:hypothetical protein